MVGAAQGRPILIALLHTAAWQIGHVLSQFAPELADGVKSAMQSCEITSADFRLALQGPRFQALVIN